MDKQKEKKCNITFIIGNGFDIGLGMKTKYEDIYKSYLKIDSDSDVIKLFKKELSSRKPYDKWSDFEMGMAEYAQKLSSEDELVECVRDFKKHMVNHIKQENDRILDFIDDSAYIDVLYRELERSLTMFYTGLTPNDIYQLKELMNEANVNRQYITFNYTTTLEKLLLLNFRYKRIVELTPVYIHGRLDSDVVLGIDNLEQLKDTSFSLTRKGKRAFVKPIFNEQYDRERVNYAKSIISQSDIICIYGFSMGESDKTWLDLLSKWLLESPKHHLVIYQYDEKKFDHCNYDEIMEIEDDKKDEMLYKLGISDESILKQIHIPIGNDIFNFKFRKVIPHTIPV